MMEASSSEGGCLSPESTVTSLLSSSGHLRSSLLPPGPDTTFTYGHKSYDSASAALDAYIADFERSCGSSEPRTGRLVLPHSGPSAPSRPKMSNLRNKDVLRENLTDWELDFLKLPVSSLHHRSNRDRVSMTTDELLAIPYDGSMPVTHTSAFIKGLFSQSGAPQPCPSCSQPAHTLSSSHAIPRLNHLLHPATTPRGSRCRGRAGTAALKPHVDMSSVSCYRCAHRAAGSEWRGPSSLHLPLWFTSNKADMDCSGITSVPDLKYPAWIKHCDSSEPPPLTESELWEHDVLPPAAPRTSAPSWVAELEGDDPDQTPAQVDGQQTLRDLRLQFAEQISFLTAKRKSSDIMETLFRDNRIEALILKADHVLTSLSQSSGRADSVADPVSCTNHVEEDALNTEELLTCSSSQSHGSNLDAVAVGITEALTDRGAVTPLPSVNQRSAHPSAGSFSQAQGCGVCGDTVFKQPGPVEALKQMLFRLQAVEAELQRQQQQASPTAATLADRLQGGGHTETSHRPGQSTRPEGETELDGFPGGPSLQRALCYLSRLKVLLEEPREPKEKNDDERHCSS